MGPNHPHRAPIDGFESAAAAEGVSRRGRPGLVDRSAPDPPAQASRVACQILMFLRSVASPEMPEFPPVALLTESPLEPP